MSRHRCRAMTLAEVLVYCVLLGIFTMLVFVNLPNRANASSVDLVESATKADHSLKRLSLELSNSSATSIAVTTSPVGVVFLAAASEPYTPFVYTASGDLAWQGWVGYFLQSSKLVRVWYPLSAGTARTAITTTPTTSEMLAKGVSRTMCTRVSSFAVTVPESNLWQFDLIVAVSGSKATVSTAAGARN